jgi:hypothetical protein
MNLSLPILSDAARWALAALTVAAGAIRTEPALAQSEIRVADVRGDQLLFVYDARPGRVSFLLVSNPGGTPVTLDASFYALSLESRLGGETLALPAGGHLVLDPANVAGGAAAGSAGLAVLTPIAGGGDPTPVVPPEPLTGGFTLANTALASAFGENAFGRLAVSSDGSRASAGSAVTGSDVRYQRLQPRVLTVPLYFDPRSLGPAESDGNRVVLAAFADRYGVGFDVAPADTSADATFLDASGATIARRTVSFAGVLLSDLQSLAGSEVPLTSSGKVFLDVRGSEANVLGVFSQSLGTFASGQRMPAVDEVPEGTTGNPGGRCAALDATASVTWDAAAFPDVSGVVVRIDYPAAIAIPGSNADPSIGERVTNLTGISDGLLEATDRPRPDSAVDDRLSIALLSLSQPVATGPFARVRFDCAPSAEAPAAAEVSCTVEAARFDGSPVTPASCALTIEVQEEKGRS